MNNTHSFANTLVIYSSTSNIEHISVFLSATDRDRSRDDSSDHSCVLAVPVQRHIPCAETRPPSVRTLLERDDVDPDKADKWGQTPLLWAANNGREGAVRMLLERNDVNPEKADKCGRTPLSLATKNRHQAVIRMLLKRKEANPAQSTLDQCSQRARPARLR